MPEILIESFDADITADGSSILLSNDVGNVANAFVKINNSTLKSSPGRIGNTSTSTPRLTGIGVELNDTDELIFYRGTLTNECKVIGEVWRYTGPANGANEFVNRGAYQVTIGAGSASASVAVTGLSNRNRAVPFLTGFTTAATSSNQFDSCTVGVYIGASGNLVVERQTTDVAVTFYVNVVEFTGSNWSIGHGVSTNHDTAMETVTLNTDSTGTGGSTFDTGNWDTAFIEGSMQGDSKETGLADVMALIYPHTDTDKVVFGVRDADANARNDGDGRIHVIQHDDITVHRAYNTNVPEQNGAYNTTAWPAGAPTDRNIDELSLEWFVSTSGTGTAFARGCLGASITAASGTITFWVHRSGNTVRARYGVIDLSQIPDDTGGGGTTGQIKVYNGSTFEAFPVKYWDGSAWVTKPVKYWNGSAWVETPY